MAAPGDENVGGLDVAMDDALGVGGVEGVGDLDGELQQDVGFERTAVDAVLQGDAFEVLHDDEGLSGGFIDFVDGADVGMIQRRGGAGFALEALERLRVGGDFGRKEFESDEASQLDVFGLVDDAHATAAEFVDDAVVGDGLANHAGSRPELRWYGGRGWKSKGRNEADFAMGMDTGNSDGKFLGYPGAQT